LLPQVGGLVPLPKHRVRGAIRIHPDDLGRLPNVVRDEPSGLRGDAGRDLGIELLHAFREEGRVIIQARSPAEEPSE
jgi:hypothetical protein